MTLETLQSILQFANREDKAELTVANSAKVRAMQTYTATPNKKSQEAYDVASRFYEETLARLGRKYLQKNEDNEEGRDPGDGRAKEWREFRETAVKAEVLSQLVAMGYEITGRTFYRHCKQGKCRPNEERLFSRRLVKQYVETEGITRRGVVVADDNGPDVALSIEKQRLENEKLRISNDTNAIKLQRFRGQLIDREALYLELAARAVTLDNGFRQKIEMTSPELIALVKGEPARQVEFVETIFQAWDELLNSFATSDEFEVLFEEEQTSIEEPETEE
jgi:hypothetical protein